MKTSQHDEQPEPRSNPLLSRATILILSCCLVAVVAQWIGDPSLRFYVFCAGSIGVVAFLSMECRANVVKLIETNRASKNADSNLIDHAGRQRAVVPKTEPTAGLHDSEPRR